MTAAQDKKYWRRWGAVTRANHWRLVTGRLAPDAVLAASEPHCRVAAAARQLAQAEAKGLTPDHLRHACHLVALGRDKSHRQFTNREFDSLLNWWGDERAITGLLIAPDDLASHIHQDAPELKARERLLLGLRRNFREGYVAKIAGDLYGTRDWQQLGDADLANLNHLLHTRPGSRRTAAGGQTPEGGTPHSALPTPQSENEPF